ncbi:hypothetical protein D3C84_1027720 [compost metagenome]
MRLKAYTAVNAAKLARRRDRFRHRIPRVVLVEQHLPLQIARLDEVAVRQPYGADASSRHMLC